MTTLAELDALLKELYRKGGWAGVRQAWLDAIDAAEELEREACADAADGEWLLTSLDIHLPGAVLVDTSPIAAAIRARGNV